MELEDIKNMLLAYFKDQFDHTLLTDQNNDPFLEISLINISQVNPHRDSFGLYLQKPGKPAVHSEFTTSVMATALLLEGKYISQKPSKAKPITEEFGCTTGTVLKKNQILLVTVIAHTDDAVFVSQSIIKKIKSVFNQ